MDIYTEAKLEQDRIMDCALLNALAVVAVLGYKEDEISERKAIELYDRGWINDRTKRGLLHFSRKGNNKLSAKIYSRFEIESLKRAEKSIQDKYELLESRVNNLKQRM